MFFPWPGSSAAPTIPALHGRRPRRLKFFRLERFHNAPKALRNSPPVIRFKSLDLLVGEFAETALVVAHGGARNTHLTSCLKKRRPAKFAKPAKICAHDG